MALNEDVQNLPGLDDRRMNQLIVLRAAQQVVGAITAWDQVDALVYDFRKWLENAADDADLLYRRYVLLVATQERRNVPHRDLTNVRKVIDDLYRKV